MIRPKGPESGVCVCVCVCVCIHTHALFSNSLGYYFPVAAVTTYHVLCGFEQHKLIITQFWRPSL